MRGLSRESNGKCAGCLTTYLGGATCVVDSASLSPPPEPLMPPLSRLAAAQSALAAATRDLDTATRIYGRLMAACPALARAYVTYLVSTKPNRAETEYALRLVERRLGATVTGWREVGERAKAKRDWAQRQIAALRDMGAAALWPRPQSKNAAVAGARTRSRRGSGCPLPRAAAPVTAMAIRNLRTASAAQLSCSKTPRRRWRFPMRNMTWRVRDAVANAVCEVLVWLAWPPKNSLRARAQRAWGKL